MTDQMRKDQQFMLCDLWLSLALRSWFTGNHAIRHIERQISHKLPELLVKI